MEKGVVVRSAICVHASVDMQAVTFQLIGELMVMFFPVCYYTRWQVAAMLLAIHTVNVRKRERQVFVLIIAYLMVCSFQ